MAREFDPFNEARLINQVLLPAGTLITREMVANLGGAGRVFEGNNLFIQEHLAAIVMCLSAQKTLVPEHDGRQLTEAEKLTSIAFTNGMKLPLLAAKHALHERTFFFMADVGRPYVEGPTGLSPATASKIAADMTEQLTAYAELGYRLLDGAYEPLIDAWEEVLVPTSGYGLPVRQGVGFISGILRETQGYMLQAMTETVLDEAFPDAV